MSYFGSFAGSTTGAIFRARAGISKNVCHTVLGSTGPVAVIKFRLKFFKK